MLDSPINVTFDVARARSLFRRVDERQILRAMLAVVAPRPGWEGCRVTCGVAPGNGAEVVCVSIQGPGAVEVRQDLGQALERFGLTLSTLDHKGCVGESVLAVVRAGLWATESPE